MPIYEYTCERCGAVVERLLRSSTAAVEAHEDCGGQLTRRMSAPVTRAGGADRATSGETDSMRRFRDNRAKAAAKKR